MVIPARACSDYEASYLFLYTYKYVQVYFGVESEFVFAENINIYIYIYTYEHIYDSGIIREIRICIRREYTYIYIYT